MEQETKYVREKLETPFWGFKESMEQSFWVVRNSVWTQLRVDRASLPPYLHLLLLVDELLCFQKPWQTLAAYKVWKGSRQLLVFPIEAIATQIQSQDSENFSFNLLESVCTEKVSAWFSQFSQSSINYKLHKSNQPVRDQIKTNRS